MLRRLFGAVSGSAIAVWAVLCCLAAPALAGLGQPTPGELGLQQPATALMSEISWLHDTINVIIIAITVFVLLLMLYVMFRFSEKNNPTPSRTTHNTALEVAWTIIPILILVGIAIPSFKLLYHQYTLPQARCDHQGHGQRLVLGSRVHRPERHAVTSNMLRDEDVLRAKLGDEAFDQKYGALEGLDASQGLHADCRSVWLERGEPAPACRRSGNRGAARQGRPPADHVQRRHPLLDHSVVRREAAGRSGPHGGRLVPGRQGRHRTTASARCCAARTTPPCRSSSAS